MPIVFAELQLTPAGAWKHQQWQPPYRIPKANRIIPTGGRHQVASMIECHPNHSHLMTFEICDAPAGLPIQDISAIVTTADGQQSAVCAPSQRIALLWHQCRYGDLFAFQVPDFHG